jgi:hypothetical protein
MRREGRAQMVLRELKRINPIANLSIFLEVILSAVEVDLRHT